MRFGFRALHCGDEAKQGHAGNGQHSRSSREHWAPAHSPSCVSYTIVSGNGARCVGRRVPSCAALHGSAHARPGSFSRSQPRVTCPIRQPRAPWRNQ
jgi:hypothetical protein